jgi:hypothetical protein
VPPLQAIVCFRPGWSQKEIACLKGMDPEDVSADQVRGHLTWEWWEVPYAAYFMPCPQNPSMYFDGLQVRLLVAWQLRAVFVSRESAFSCLALSTRPTLLHEV